jgi:hypothetical protein
MFHAQRLDDVPCVRGAGRVADIDIVAVAVVSRRNRDSAVSATATAASPGAVVRRWPQDFYHWHAACLAASVHTHAVPLHVYSA